MHPNAIQNIPFYFIYLKVSSSKEKKQCKHYTKSGSLSL